MSKKLELFDITSKNFLQVMEQLVSNDKQIREKAFPKLKEYLKQSYENNIELYQKISRSLFYFYFNTDKPNYQLSMAKLISSLIYMDENNKILIPNHELWISTLLSEFGKKFKSIDVLRLDKYIMLCDQVISTYLTACLDNKLYNSINTLIKNFSEEIKFNNYNFSFESNKIKIINRFINVLFDNNSEIKNKQDFIKNKENGFFNFYKSLLEFYKEIKDKREIDFFSKNIFDNLLNKISNIKKNNLNKIYLDLISNIKNVSETFLEKNKNILVKPKIKTIDYFINKIKDENYTNDVNMENNIIDPVNDYIMNKKYKQKFRKSKREIKQEKKENKKHNDKKELKATKKYVQTDIVFDKIEVEKEIINLNNEEGNEEKNNNSNNILNKKTKRNKKETSQKKE